MAFTNAWDEAQPPDIQAANLLGQDIRSLKTDVRERICMSGLIANRPAPEAAFVGLLYFSTDEGKIYRWDGAAWQNVTAQVSGSTMFLNSIPVSGDITVAGGSLQVIVIPANTLQVGDLIEILAGVKTGDHVGIQPGVSVYFGGVSVAGATLGATACSWVFRAYGLVFDVASEQFFGDNSFTAGTSAINGVAAPVNAGIIVNTNTTAPLGATVTSQFLRVRIDRRNV